MKKRVLIITINSYNYGNRLQNYATTSVLNKMGIFNRTLCFNKPNFFVAGLFFKRCIHHITNYRFANNKEYWQKEINRDITFEKFSKRYIPMKYNQNINTLPENYDYYFTGSDQVWNPLWYKETEKEYYLLSFAKPQKRVSFCASFGVESLPTEWEDYFRTNLTKFKALSVRESAGANIIYNLTNRTSDVLIDPTLMLTSNEWDSIAKKPKGFKENEPYVLTYFLSPPCENAKRHCEELQHNMKVLSLLDSSDKVCYYSGPSEFIYLFKHASIILTDSFHACVFSFLYNKPFIVYDRQMDGINMNSRLKTFLSTFDLERKYAGSGLENDIWEHDYAIGYKQLDVERKKTMRFLVDVLGDS